jgi:predicted transcriptional regulator
MEILTKRGEVKELSRIMQVSKATVIKALKFRTDSDLARKIRTTAIKRGGVKVNS